MKLTRFNCNLGREYARRDFEKLSADYTVLMQQLPTLFPTPQQLDVQLANLKRTKRESFTVDYSTDQLLYHTRDNDWLSKYLLQTVKKQVPDSQLTWQHASMFVQHVDDFDRARTAYERNVVEAQIRYMLNHDEINGLLPAFYSRHDTARYSLCYDYEFRAALVNGLAMNTHIPYDTIVETVERRTDLWLRPTMSQTFLNHMGDDYYDVLRIYQKQQPAQADAVEKTQLIHREIWLQLRENDYYTQHQAVIDRLGTATPAMRLPEKAVAKLKQAYFKSDEKLQSLMQKAYQMAERSHHSAPNTTLGL